MFFLLLWVALLQPDSGNKNLCMKFFDKSSGFLIERYRAHKISERFFSRPPSPLFVENRHEKGLCYFLQAENCQIKRQKAVCKVVKQKLLNFRAHSHAGKVSN